MPTIDLDRVSVRSLNQRLHDTDAGLGKSAWHITNPRGHHSLAVGIDAPCSIYIDGHVGYYCGGMNKEAHLTIAGHAGPGLAENIVSGVVRVKGNASQSVGAAGRGGLIVIEGDASSRCGISMKGVDIVVGGSVGNMSAFMAQAGRLIVCGDAGAGLGDSIYEAEIYVRGNVMDLGADCIEKKLSGEHLDSLSKLLERAGLDLDPVSFRRFGSARKLYNFHVDHTESY